MFILEEAVGDGGVFHGETRRQSHNYCDSLVAIETRGVSNRQL